MAVPNCFGLSTMAFILLFLPWPALAQEECDDPETCDVETMDSESPGGGEVWDADGAAYSLDRRSGGVIEITGRVMVGGAAPDAPARVVAICDNAVLAEALTNLKGLFSLQLSSGAQPDAGQNSGAEIGEGGWPGGVAGRGLRDCEVRVSFPGHRPETVLLGDSGARGKVNVGTITIRPVRVGETATVSATSLLAPKNAVDALARGREAANKGRLDEARKQFERAVGLYPKYAEAWSELGYALEQLHNLDRAQEACRQALAADSRYARPYLQLASIAASEQRWGDVLDMTAGAIHLDPTRHPSAYFYTSLAQYNLRDFNAAERSARQTLEFDTSHLYPQANQLLAFILVEKGDFATAAECLRVYLTLVPKAKDADQTRKQLAALDAGRRP